MKVVYPIHVKFGDRSYDIRIDHFPADSLVDALATAFESVRFKTRSIAVLIDEQVAVRSHTRVSAIVDALDERFPRVQTLLLAPGEASKSMSAVEATCHWLSVNRYDRNAAIVAIGGGATSDHAGFAASIYMRGIRFATIPTTLLAMVDASVGGKTGVSLPMGKNLIGTYHQPSAVIADLGFLETLPVRERAAGMAEVVKIGLAVDGPLFAKVERLGAAAYGDALAEVIDDAVRAKVDVVMEDERENDRRASLNFGHTFGHGIESVFFPEVLHGEAVSLGMVAALALGQVLGVSDAALRKRVVSVLKVLGLPTNAAPYLQPGIIDRVEADKKRHLDGIRFVLVARPGEHVFYDVKFDELRSRLLPEVCRVLQGAS